MRYWCLGAVLLAGCTSVNNDLSKVVDAMAKDPATACFSGTYAGASVTFSRTNILNGKVNCNGNGMSVESAPVPAK